MENPYKPLNFLSEGKRDNIYIYIYSCEIPKEGGVRMRLGIVVVFVVVGLVLLGSAPSRVEGVFGIRMDPCTEPACTEACKKALGSKFLSASCYTVGLDFVCALADKIQEIAFVCILAFWVEKKVLLYAIINKVLYSLMDSCLLLCSILFSFSTISNIDDGH